MGSGQVNHSIRHWIAVFKKVSFEGMHYIIDADMKNYFGSIDHQCLKRIP